MRWKVELSVRMMGQKSGQKAREAATSMMWRRLRILDLVRAPLTMVRLFPVQALQALLM